MKTRREACYIINICVCITKIAKFHLCERYTWVSKPWDGNLEIKSSQGKNVCANLDERQKKMKNYFRQSNKSIWKNVTSVFF